ncbi:hypothetical protein GCM10007416_34150 [Kroppenstedtia guangzhouensis]|uniref:Uncharacterized protein n=1 Tax=Kroppenstedtia guangzhouensis TaxID=1274356 RepID=A0ABQ1H499_9BACL|nr:replication-relaxation family protein [Kroppenstedtia guangzhouensis]GGA58114.1 hypothetical protein GCM10007416_34150 [Kroppenstedtia guangzhouensis]
MIFKWLFHDELNKGEKLIMILYELGMASMRQLSVITGWKESTIRGVISRVKDRANQDERRVWNLEEDPVEQLKDRATRKAKREQWIRNEETRYPLDPTAYALGREGMKQAYRIMNQPIPSIREEDYSQSAHTLGLNEILTRLIQAGTDRQKIVWLSTRGAAFALYRLVRLQDPEVDPRELIRPDARLILEGLRFWIEYDNDTEGAEQLEQKFREYIDTLKPLNQIWVDPQGNKQKPLDQSPVVWVCKNEKRTRELQMIWNNVTRLWFQGKWTPEMHFFTAGTEMDFLLGSSKTSSRMKA